MQEVSIWTRVAGAGLKKVAVRRRLARLSKLDGRSPMGRRGESWKDAQSGRSTEQRGHCTECEAHHRREAPADEEPPRGAGILRVMG